MIVGLIEFLSKDRDQDIKMVEIGLSILSADPSENEHVSPAREWAIRLVEKHSGEEFSVEDKKLLLNEPIKTANSYSGDDVLGAFKFGLEKAREKQEKSSVSSKTLSEIEQLERALNKINESQ